jgi:hypothetical protein
MNLNFYLVCSGPAGVMKESIPICDSTFSLKKPEKKETKLALD